MMGNLKFSNRTFVLQVSSLSHNSLQFQIQDPFIAAAREQGLIHLLHLHCITLHVDKL